VFRASIEDDLNTSGALGALFDLVRDINRMMDAGQCAGAAAGHVLDQLRDFDKILACLDVDREEAVPADIQALANERQAARKAKDFARADAARNRLLELGWIVEDTPKGPRVKRKP
jgi:cysteinyl-tRNA synthetase